MSVQLKGKALKREHILKREAERRAEREADERAQAELDQALSDAERAKGRQAVLKALKALGDGE